VILGTAASVTGAHANLGQVEHRAWFLSKRFVVIAVGKQRGHDDGQDSRVPFH
jgi:hypothetical protein